MVTVKIVTDNHRLFRVTMSGHAAAGQAASLHEMAICNSLITAAHYLLGGIRAVSGSVPSVTRRHGSGFFDYKWKLPNRSKPKAGDYMVFAQVDALIHGFFILLASLDKEHPGSVEIICNEKPTLWQEIKNQVTFQKPKNIVDKIRAFEKYSIQ